MIYLSDFNEIFRPDKNILFKGQSWNFKQEWLQPCMTLKIP